ncbi:HNH endonuclease [Streptomyces chartreusis]|uniref:HNH endonuclease n=1 Tax=Streptomyces chartreusis TaxID=1969 RepID=UPI00371C1053
MPASTRRTCVVCDRPNPRPDRDLCGAELCAEAALLRVQYERALAAARAAVSAPRCARCDQPTNKPARYSHCAQCVEDMAELRRADERREREREAEIAAQAPCHGPGCSNPVGRPDKPSQAKLYCSARCSKAAEYLRRRARTRPEPISCRRCGTRHVPKFRDGVCKACVSTQRTVARRKSLRDAVSAKHGNSHCWHCSTSLADGAVFDHLKPVTRGGVSDVANCRWVCEPCNKSKGDLLLDEWAAPTKFVCEVS